MPRDTSSVSVWYAARPHEAMLILVWDVGTSCLGRVLACGCLASLALVSTAASTASRADLEPLPSSVIGTKAPPPPPLPPTGTMLPDLPAASITVVKRAYDLWEASANLAQDIEIQAHLDLRGFRPVSAYSRNIIDEPATSGLSLLVVEGKMRSMRGNCSDPDAATALGLNPAQAEELLSLKPRQCLVLVQDPFLAVTGGNFWLDNLYLRVLRTRVLPHFSFLISDLSSEVSPKGSFRHDVTYVELCVTNTTFQAEFQRSAVGVTLMDPATSLLLEDCIFTDWFGVGSAVSAIRGGLVNVVDTVFRNVHLNGVLVDISYYGAVRFHNASLANVILLLGLVIFTSAPISEWSEEYDDYSVEAQRVRKHYTEELSSFDVTLTEVPIYERSMFGEEFVIEEALMSDCVFLQVSLAKILPGCPPESLKQSNAILKNLRLEDYYYDYMLKEGVEDPLNEYFTEDAALRRNEDLLERSSPWLLAMQGALKPLPPPPLDWKPFVVPPRPPEIRTDIARGAPPPPGLLVPGLHSTVPEVTAADRVVATSEVRGGRRDLMLAVVSAVVLVAVALVVVAAVWAAVALRRLESSRPEYDAGAVAAERQRRRLQIWMSVGLGSTTGTHAAGVMPLVANPGSRPRRRALLASAAPPDNILAFSCGLVPPSVMNPAYEYLLPTHLAMLMSAPTATHQTKDEHILDAPVNRRGSAAVVTEWHGWHGRGDTLTPRGARLLGPSATQTAGIPMVRVLARTEGSGCGRSEKSLRGSRTVPLGRSCSPFAVAGGLRYRYRYDLTHSTRSMHTMTMTGTAHYTPTVDGTISSTIYECEMRTVGSGIPPGVTEVGPDTNLAPTLNAGPTVSSVGTGDPRIRRLYRMLDGFQEEDLFLGRFVLLGRDHRRCGGQAVVQFAEGRDSCEFAVKFFLDWDSFLTEAALYAAAFPHIRARVSASVLARADATAGLDGCGSSAMSQVLARCLPQVEAVCDSAGGLEDAVGRPLPPCIVLEKGESLLDWNDRAQPDIFTYLSVLSSLSQRLADMHDAGYVHRDLKPANIMWLPRQNRWTVLGFGCVARVGEAGPLSPTLAYAAPEVVRAYDLQEQQIEVTPALDVWSLGVMAFELLMGASAFNLLEDGSAGVMQRLRGDLPLPWEGELGPSAKSKLGAFKEPVLGLLQRDPGRRPTMRAFHATCNRLFARTT